MDHAQGQQRMALVQQITSYAFDLARNAWAYKDKDTSDWPKCRQNYCSVGAIGWPRDFGWFWEAENLLGSDGDARVQNRSL